MEIDEEDDSCGNDQGRGFEKEDKTSVLLASLSSFIYTYIQYRCLEH